ncbi:MAG: hypothetical protein AAF266_09375 [Planctomycetota bacterium]
MSDSNSSTVMPTWFRRTLIVVASLLMCSCRAYGQDCLACPVDGPCSSGPCLSDSCESGGCVVDGCPVCQTECHAGPGDEYLCDGGDQAYSVGVLNDGSMVGLEQEDTVATYTGCEGRVKVAPSTRVCIYAPRFASVRRVVHPMGANQRTFVDAVGDLFGAAEADRSQPASTSLQNVALKGQALPLPTGLYKGRMQAGGIERHLSAAETRSLGGPYVNLQLMTLGVIEMAEAPIVADLSLAAITWTGDQEVQVTVSGQATASVFSSVQPGLLYHTEDGCPRLRLVKCASTDTAVPGDEIEFTLRYDNIGDGPLDDLVIVDNLTTRLEYIEDSAKSSLDAEFSTARNGAGSLVLRWQIAGKIEPQTGGLLTFRCRVR